MTDNYQYYARLDEPGEYFLELEDVVEYFVDCEECPEVFKTKPSNPRDHFTPADLAEVIFDRINDEPLVCPADESFGSFVEPRHWDSLVDLLDGWLKSVDTGTVQPDYDAPVDVRNLWEEYWADISANV